MPTESNPDDCGSPVIFTPDELEALKSKQAALAPAPGSVDGTARLCAILYGRKDEPRDWIGGSNAKMIHDAAREIERLRILAAFCEGVLSIVEGHAFNVEGVKEARRRIAAALSPNSVSPTTGK